MDFLSFTQGGGLSHAKFFHITGEMKGLQKVFDGTDTRWWF